MDRSQWQEAAKQYWTKPDNSAYDQSIRTAMENDPEFKKYVLDHENVFAVLEYAVAEDLKQKMSSWQNQNGKVIQLSNPARRWRTFVARAAMILLIVVASMYFWPVDRYEQALELYATLPSPATRGEEIPKTDETYYYRLFMDSKANLKNKEYQEALDKMRGIIEAKPDEIIVDFAEWNVLLILRNIDPKGPEYKELYMKIKSDENHGYHDKLNRIRKWGI